MARMPKTVPLKVLLNGRSVGTLRKASTGAIDFTYDSDWLQWEHAFPVSLSLPLREDRYIGAPVVNVFDNLLPDNEAIRRRVSERVGAEGTDAYSMLAALGQDCVGALQFLPIDSEPPRAGSIDGKPVSDEDISALITNLVAAPLGMDEDADFRISIAGAQEKTALLRYNGQWLKPRGTTATTHILKPQIGQLPNGVDLSDSVENEYFCMKLLDALGVPTANVEMTNFGTRRTLVVERFDRIWTRDGRLLRRPQEDCCQALSIPPTRKYQADGGPGLCSILELLKGSDTPERDIAMFLRANIVFWLIGATDGHAKNFSVFLNPRGGYSMTPLYDVLTAQPSLDANQISHGKFKLAMSVGKKNHYRVLEIMPRHFLQTAEVTGVSTSLVTSIFEELTATAVARANEMVDVLPAGFPGSIVESTLSGMKSRLRLIETEAELNR